MDENESYAVEVIRLGKLLVQELDKAKVVNMQNAPLFVAYTSLKDELKKYDLVYGNGEVIGVMFKE